MGRTICFCCSLVGKMRRVLHFKIVFFVNAKTNTKRSDTLLENPWGLPGKNQQLFKKNYAVDREICRFTSWYFCNRSLGGVKKPEILSLLERWQLRIILKILNHLVVDDPLFSWWLVGTTRWLVFQDVVFGNTSIMIFIMLIILYISYLPMEPSLNLFYKETVF